MKQSLKNLNSKRRASSPPSPPQAKRTKRMGIKTSEHPVVTTDVTVMPASVSQEPDQSSDSPVVSSGLGFRNIPVSRTSEWANSHRIELLGADVYYQPNLIDEETADRWYSELSKLETWYRPTLALYGKPYVQSRSIASYMTSPNLKARYSGHSVQMNYPYPPLLTEIQDTVSKALGIGFDHVMLNWYQDGSVHIGKHRDVKENQVIASLSLGAPRTFIMQPHISKGKPKVEAESKRWTLENGSLVVMQGDTQENSKHEIPKEPKIKAGRISLTFRQLVHEKS